MRKFIPICMLVIFCGLGYQISYCQSKHPLDPLRWDEYWKVLESLHKAGHLNDSTGFSMVNLVEPDKQKVWSWKEGITLPRKAFATVHQNGKTYKAEVDLDNEKELSFIEQPGAQGTWLGSEFNSVVKHVLKNEEFAAGLRKRGYTDFTLVDCAIFPRANFGEEEYKGRRIGQCMCRDSRYVRNTWTRGIEGLYAVVDVTSKEVLKVVDEGVVPMASVKAEFDWFSTRNEREVPSPILVSQPDGPGFKITGNIIEWQNWKFHVKPDHRVGAVISTVTYRDKNEVRPVMYQGHLSEIFVPYMDPSFGWFIRNFIDAGEYTAGGLIKPLMRGQDAPDYAYYMDGLFSNDNGRPFAKQNVLAVFERESGDPSWRHNGAAATESRVKRDLVVRVAAVLGNYDYLFDWIFQQDGSIRVLVGATGVAEAKVVAQKDASSPVKGEAGDKYGRYVDPNIVAVNHDHYFSFRIDLDVDGPINNLQLDKLRRVDLPEGHPRRSVWTNQPYVVQKESEAKLTMDLNKPTLWRMTSTTRKNHVGYSTSYQLMPGKTANTLLSEDDYPRRRVGFINHHLWATPYNKSELFAAGDYPTLSEPGKGLPEWSSKDRSLANTDIVLWYTVGMHHMVRAEDWPVMPVLWHSFEIRPFDFFNGNPALDLPK